MQRILRIVLLAWVAIVALGVLVVGRTFLDWWKPIPASTGQPFTFADDFERGSETLDLFQQDFSRWHGRQLVPQQNEVELTTKRAHSGRQALRCLASASADGITSRADIQLERLRFVQGDDVWSQCWLYFGEAGDWNSVFLWDLEASTKWKSPGRRVYIQGENRLASGLGKWFGSNTVRQPLAPRIGVPVNKWFRLRIHLHLSAKKDGRIEVWQDEAKVLDAACQTLPTAQAVYDRWQIGLTANGSSRAHVLYVDDIIISNQPIL